MYATNLHQIFTIGRSVGADYSDLHFSTAQGTLPWQPILGPTRRIWLTLPSFVALAFRNGLEYGTSMDALTAAVIPLHLLEIW